MLAGLRERLFRDGRLEARLASSALAALADLLTETPGGEAALRVGGALRPLPPRPPAV